MLRSIVFLLSVLTVLPAFAETQTVKRGRLKYSLNLAGMPPARASNVLNNFHNVLYYDTAVELLAASPTAGTVGYAIDTSLFYFRSGSSWDGTISLSTLTGANGGTIANGTNNVWTFTENSEDITFTYAADLVTLASTTSATFAITPAVAFADDVSAGGGTGAVTFTAASSSVVMPDSSATALVLGAPGALAMMTFDTTDGLERVKITGDFEVTGNQIQPLGFSEGFGEGASKGLATLQLDGTAFDGTAGTHNMAHVGNGHKLLYFPIVGQTQDLVMSAVGLDISMDQVDNDGMEIFSGVLGSTGRMMIVGTDAAASFCVDFTIADGNGTDDFHIGWRAAETANATFDSYTDFASLSIVTVADPALVQIETNLASAGTVTTSTTDTLADATSTEWCTLVSGAGVVTYTIDGVPPSTTAAFTFGDGTPIIPFVHLLQANVAQTGALPLESWAAVFD